MHALSFVQTSNLVPHARHRLSVAILFRRSVNVKRYIRNLQLGFNERPRGCTQSEWRTDAAMTGIFFFQLLMPSLPRKFWLVTITIE